MSMDPKMLQRRDLRVYKTNNPYFFNLSRYGFIDTKEAILAEEYVDLPQVPYALAKKINQISGFSVMKLVPADGGETLMEYAVLRGEDKRLDLLYEPDEEKQEEATPEVISKAEEETPVETKESIEETPVEVKSVVEETPIEEVKEEETEPVVIEDISVATAPADYDPSVTEYNPEIPFTPTTEDAPKTIDDPAPVVEEEFVEEVVEEEAPKEVKVEPVFTSGYIAPVDDEIIMPAETETTSTNNEEPIVIDASQNPIFKDAGPSATTVAETKVSRNITMTSGLKFNTNNIPKKKKKH